MRRNSLLLLICLAAVAVSACAKTQKVEAAGDDPHMAADTGAVSAEKTETAATSTGVIYVNNAGLYTETEDGKMKWVAEASLGDIALYLGEKKEAVRTDGQKRTFFHVRLNDKVYWVQEYSYEPDTVPAFISGQDVILYKSESLAAMTDEFIPRYTIIAVYKDSLEKTADKFIKIAAYSPELITSWSIKEKYVKRDTVETDTASVEAMILAQVAMESRNDTIRTELFQNAIELGSSYSDEIAILQALAESIVQEENMMKGIAPEKINETVTALDDLTTVSIPDSQNARPLSMLKAGSTATATRKYFKKDENSESEEEWLYIQQKQKKGWVPATLVKKEQ